MVMAAVVYSMLVSSVITTGIPACDNRIWCDGPILQAIQTAHLFNDSKTFVDMNLKQDADRTQEAFTNLSQSGSPSRDQLQAFVQQYFEGPGNEFEPWQPPDYVSEPSFLHNVKDKHLKDFGKELCKIWSQLGRKIKDDVRVHQDRYSLIYLEHPFIVPGGRFREIYYWDSYWVIKGLLACDMVTTVKGMLENLISFVKRYGLVPNGGRIYYTRRSQPPLLTPMVDLYIHKTRDMSLLRNNLKYLDQEYQFWMTNRNVTVPGGGVNSHTLNRYATPISKPRPESYREDIETVEKKGLLPDSAAAHELFSNLASAAESGWDFSSRWFSRDYYKNADKGAWLGYTSTRDVVPVDLNSILCWNERLLSQFHRLMGNHTAENRYHTAYMTRMAAIQDVFWNTGAGTWFDYSLSTGSEREAFYPSNLFPLYAGCVESSRKDAIEKRILNYLKDKDVLKYISGVPTSLVLTGQQWDMPNAWPPLQDVIISALDGSNNTDSRKSALKLAQSWVNSNWWGWKRTKRMFEKYVVTKEGSRGTGGEYGVQVGFGWTNGVVLSLLERFGADLHVSDPSSSRGLLLLPNRNTVVVLAMLLVLSVCV